MSRKREKLNDDTPGGQGARTMPFLPCRLFRLIVAWSLLTFFIGEGITFIAANSQTADEAAHLVAGYHYLVHGDVNLNPEYPPLLRALSALPVYLCYQLPLKHYPLIWQNYQLWHIGRQFLYTSPVPGQQILSLARVPSLVLGTALVGLIGLWAYRLWGWWAGLLSLSLAVLEPNLIVHSSVVTTDIGETLFIFLSIYLLWEYISRPSGWLLVAIGITTGAALASKHLAVLLPIMTIFLLGGQALLGRTVLWPWPGVRSENPLLCRRLAAVGCTFGVVIVIAAAIVELVYGGQGIETWWKGFKVARETNREGYPAFFLGEYSREGWWAYYPIAFLIKTPLGSLALIAASLLLFRLGRSFTLWQGAFLFLPVVIWLLAMSWSRINVGLRHILPIYPFLFVAAGRLVTVQWRRRWLLGMVIGLPLSATAVSTLRVAPHQIAYFNELVGGPENGFRCLSDSNLDWGQDLKGLKAYIDQEGVPMIYLAYYDTAPPAAYGIRYQYLPAFGPLGPPSSDVLPQDVGRELLVIGVMNLQGVHFTDKNLYLWLYSRKPVATIGYSIFIYDLTHDINAHLHLIRIYEDENRRDLATRELRRVLALDPNNPAVGQFLYLLREAE